jgi:hypothetical protein
MPNRVYASSDAHIVLMEQAVVCRRCARQTANRADVELLLWLADAYEARATGKPVSGAVSGSDDFQQTPRPELAKRLP